MEKKYLEKLIGQQSKFVTREPGEKAVKVINGKIEEVIYVGETKRYMIRISETETIHMREMSTRIGKGRQKGENVIIGWFKESLRKLE